MSVAVAERAPRTRHSAQHPHRDGEVARRGDSARADDGLTPSTLAESLARAWEDLASRGSAECLVCGGEMVRAAAATRADCSACGASLD